MDPTKSLDNVLNIIAALLHDVQNIHGVVFNNRARRLTLKKIEARTRSEGIGFLTKTLPRLGRAFDKALSGQSTLDAAKEGFKPLPNSKLPKFLGELFRGVLADDGGLLPSPCVNNVQTIRQVLFLFKNYELGYTDEQERKVIEQFGRTEQELSAVNDALYDLRRTIIDDPTYAYRKRRTNRTIAKEKTEVVHEARCLLSRLFAFFDPKDILPRHGPGAVATKQRLWGKYQWSNISAKITRQYPSDAYYYASLGHVCDRLDSFSRILQEDLPARVILVPKDSRGPRLISCEPVDYQWIQQGLGRAIVELCEKHYLTQDSVFFTDQEPNRMGAIIGSHTGKYVTLDLKEASDRVSLELVRLLFPKHVLECLEACRSSSTVLPDGMILPLQKFAPMGSALCFPVLALTIWAILAAGMPDVYALTCKSVWRIHVYGDDVIVPTDYSENAIKLLESFGLLVNRDKSCTSGLFRESCGMDAFKGKNVTPVRLRTVWSSSRSPESYTSWIAYANQFYDRKYFTLYDLIVENLLDIYGEFIPEERMSLTSPSLREVPLDRRPKRCRVNRDLQKKEWLVYDVKSPTTTKEIDGWSMLLRYFTEGGKAHSMQPPVVQSHDSLWRAVETFRVRKYTRRSTSMLVKRWR